MAKKTKSFIDEMKKIYADSEMEVRVPWEDDKEPILVFNAKARLPYDDKIEIEREKDCILFQSVGKSLNR